MFSGGIGLPEVLLVLAIILIIFGPKRLPALGRSLGSGMRNFKESISGKGGDEEEDEGEGTGAPAKPQLTSSKADAPAADDEVVSERRG
jgi:sec-independent protein translocase protein TatA